MTARVLANLDCEVAWAGGAPLPAHVRAKLGALGTLLRALVPGDHAELALCGPVDPARVPDVGPRWRAVPDAGDDAIRWGAPASDVIRRVADRRFAVALRDELGVGLPGTRVVTSIEELEAAPATRGAWIAKAPISAAGRDRVRRRGPPDAETRARLARLLAKAGALVVEPWLARTVDVGQSGRVTDDGVELLPAHRLHVDAGGGFAGIAITDALGLAPVEHAQLREVARACGVALARAGYRGPFTVDAFAYTDDDGARRFHPLCECNPRLTFGFVARGWAARLGAPLTLRIAEGAPPPDAITLVAPTAADPTAAWLELSAAT
jgi:hypothetical protein